METSEAEFRAHLTFLIKSRDRAEADILRMFDELSKHDIGLDEPLVDDEGYPRSDIDICAIRYLRHEIICKRNDCKNLTKQIEEGLHAFHAGISTESLAARKVPAASCDSDKPRPFARVDMVDAGSPAQKADLCAGDLIIKFATVTASNFDNMGTLAEVVAQNVQKPIRVNVLRDNAIVPLILVPQSWSGPGFLGCKVIPLRT